MPDTQNILFHKAVGYLKMALAIVRDSSALDNDALKELGDLAASVTDECTLKIHNTLAKSNEEERVKSLFEAAVEAQGD